MTSSHCLRDALDETRNALGSRNGHKRRIVRHRGECRIEWYRKFVKQDRVQRQSGCREKGPPRGRADRAASRSRDRIRCCTGCGLAETAIRPTRKVTALLPYHNSQPGAFFQSGQPEVTGRPAFGRDSIEQLEHAAFFVDSERGNGGISQLRHGIHVFAVGMDCEE